jgi:hypothetical protein
MPGYSQGRRLGLTFGMAMSDLLWVASQQYHALDVAETSEPWVCGVLVEGLEEELVELCVHAQRLWQSA